jgi:hypothetical protein
MIIVTISPETSELEVREGFRLALPKFLWTVLEARAKTMHKGDLNAAVMGLASEELLDWFSESIRKVVGPVSGNN